MLSRQLDIPLKRLQEILNQGNIDDYIKLFSDHESFIEEKIKQLPMQNKKARATKSFFISSAVDCELDSQGRILLPQTLREFAGITKEVAIVGNIERIEIWDITKWNERNDEIAENMDDIVEDLGELGIIF